MADKRRRKSLSIFKQKSDGNAGPSTPSSTATFTTDDASNPSSGNADEANSSARPRTLQKTHRASMLGSLRSLRSLDEDDKAALTRTDSKSSSTYDEPDIHNRKGLFGNTVLMYGESQAAIGNVFRKRSHFAVLTDSHLIRFRNQTKAAEMFPTIPATISRTSTRMSAGSYTELQMSTYHDITSGVPLEQVIAVYNLDDGRPFFTVEVAYLDERGKRASALQLHLHDPRESDQWISSIRSAAAQARARTPKKLHKSAIDYVARILGLDRDYEPSCFHMFKVVQRAPKQTTRASAEDLTKMTSSICYMAFGLHKLHLAPINRASKRSSTTSLHDVESPTSFGYATLTSIKLQAEEDSFQLGFKFPTRQPTTLTLASADCGEIALRLRYASEYIRPEWLRQPFVFDVPPDLDEKMQPPPAVVEDYAGFDRTLTAYCAAYDIDTSRIFYTVDHHCEDHPRFQLLAPADGRPYTALELLAVFRSLRYNESFSTISFANIDLCPLRYLYDVHATDLDSLCSRSGMPSNLVGHYDLPVLCQEVRALALKSRRLRRFDFSSCFMRLSQGEEERDSCCIPEALVPLFKKSLTNVDWIILNNVHLADSDLNYLVDAASERTCHLRALEIGDCGLSVHDVDVLLSTLAAQENTMEVINISGIQGRFSPEIFQREIGAFSHIRRLNLTRVQKTAGPEPLLPPEILMTWRLEALYLSGTTLNEQTVDSISAYLASPRSEILRELHLDQCGLSGRDLAVFFRSMTRKAGEMRLMQVSASENRLKQGMSNLFNAIRESCGPSMLTMRMMDFEREHHFRELVEALTKNTTLRSLDISRASLPYDASLETCEALKTMFASNRHLEELDISGEHAHLDATRFGIGLNNALEGLKRNETLRLLRIEHQKLGLQGAYTLAGVIENNQTLLEIHCEHNEINLQSFTVLINALEKNTTLQYLPAMDEDRARSLEKVRREAEAMDGTDPPKASPRKTSGSIKRSFTGALGSRRYTHQRVMSSSSAGSYSSQDANIALHVLEEKWSAQAQRLQDYLYRNYCLATGIAWREERPRMSSDKRPDTASPPQKMLDRVALGGRSSGADGHSLPDGLSEGGRGGPQRSSAAVFELPDH